MISVKRCRILKDYDFAKNLVAVTIFRVGCLPAEVGDRDFRVHRGIDAVSCADFAFVFIVPTSQEEACPKNTIQIAVAS